MSMCHGYYNNNNKHICSFSESSDDEYEYVGMCSYEKERAKKIKMYKQVLENLEIEKPAAISNPSVRT